MKAILKIKTESGCKEIEVEVEDTIGKQLFEDSSKKETGYERVPKNKHYYFMDDIGDYHQYNEHYDDIDDKIYNNANYYSSKKIAKNNIRADKLMRQLRRFAIVHRKNKIEWKSEVNDKYEIVFDYEENQFNVIRCFSRKNFGGIYFDSKKTANLAINTFSDELMWYFMEYKDSL